MPLETTEPPYSTEPLSLQEDHCSGSFMEEKFTQIADELSKTSHLPNHTKGRSTLYVYKYSVGIGIPHVHSLCGKMQKVDLTKLYYINYMYVQYYGADLLTGFSPLCVQSP